MKGGPLLVVILLFTLCGCTHEFATGGNSLRKALRYPQSSSSSIYSDPTPPTPPPTAQQQTPVSIYRILKELETHLDKYITRGTKASITGALKCLEDIKKEEADLQLLSFGKKTEYYAQGVRACKRAGLDDDVLSGKKSQSLPVNYREDHTDKKDDFGKMRNKYVQPGIRQAPKAPNTNVGADGSGDDGSGGDDVATRPEPSLLLQSSFTDSIPLGGIKPILQSLHRRLLIPLSTPPQLMRELGMSPCKGVLFYGPSGCGKTRLATYLASTLSPGREITVVNGPEIMKKFVGESEELVRQIFTDPPPPEDGFPDDTRHVIVFDEFDAIARVRGGQDGKQGDAGVARDSVVNQLLSMIDGVDTRNTFVLACTNRRELIDRALLRPGRFEIQIEIKLPEEDARREIFEIHTKSMKHFGRIESSDFSGLLAKLAKDSDGMSGAEIEGICRSAASRALERVVLEHGDNEAMLLKLVKVKESDFLEGVVEMKESTDASKM